MGKIRNKKMKKRGGENNMLARNLTLLVAVFAMAALLSFGCGGSKTSEMYTGPTSTIRLSAGANAFGAIFDVSQNVFYDAGAGSTGTGGTIDGVDAINDTASATCTFNNFPLSTAATDIDIEVTTTPPGSTVGNCASENKCIRCDVVPGSDCTLSCLGTIPSNAETASDYLTYDIVFTHTFVSNMPQAYDKGVDTVKGTSDDIGGVIRFDGFISNWPDFDPTVNTPNQNIAACDGGSDMTVVKEPDPLADALGIQDMSSTTMSISYPITVLDPDLDPGPPEVFGECAIAHTLQSDTIYFTGADNAGAVIELTGNRACLPITDSGTCNGTDGCAWDGVDSLCRSTNSLVALAGTICDDVTNCPAPCSILADQGSCDALLGCQWASLECIPLCSDIPSQIVCEAVSVCLWSGGVCDVDCAGFDAQAECEQYGCTWSGSACS